VAFYVCLPLLSVMYSKFVYVALCVSSSFLFMIKWYSVTWIYGILFIHLSVNGCFGYCHFLAIMNNVTMNILVQVFMWMYVFNILRVELLGYSNSLSETPSGCFYKQLHDFTFPLAVCEGTNFSTSLPTLTIGYLLL
jgi:hypothetical protein